MKANLSINEKNYAIDVPEAMPLLWAIRDSIGLTGTKFGCGVAQCGACSVLVDGVLMKSCSIPISFGIGKKFSPLKELLRI